MRTLTIDDKIELVSLGVKGAVRRSRKRVCEVLGDVGIHPDPKAMVFLTTEEKVRLRAHLMNAYGFRNAAFDAELLKGSRSHLIRLFENEKSGADRVKGGRVKWRVLPDTVLPNGFRVPLSTVCQDAPKDLIALCDTGIILIENGEVFENIERLSFPVPEGLRGFIVIFRGDPENPQNVCEDFLRAAKRPVFVFPDFDPAGLGMAIKVPNFSGIMHPDLSVLENALKEHGSREAYAKQFAQYANILDGAEDASVAEIWGLIKRYHVGLMQEAFLNII